MGTPETSAPGAAPITAFHDSCLTADAWARHATSRSREAVWRAIEDNHQCNCKLWAEEDLARRRSVPDSEIAKNKRTIDIQNQKRNDAIERLDEELQHLFSAIRTAPNARLNSETPGSIIDRLSILSLKIHHMRLQTLRSDVGQAHIEACAAKLARLIEQRADLGACLDRLLAERSRGEACFKIYHQFKMYNDPALNPEIYAETRNSRDSDRK